MMNDSSKYSSILRRTLWLNAIFSGISAVECLAASETVGRFVGLPPGEVFSLGVNLALFAAFLVFLVTRRDLTGRWIQGAVLAVIAMDVLWVLGSAAALLTPATSLTVAGKWTVFLVAVAVADFAAFQFVGWRGLRGAARATPEIRSAA